MMLPELLVPAQAVGEVRERVLDRAQQQPRDVVVADSVPSIFWTDLSIGGIRSRAGYWTRPNFVFHFST